MFCSWMWPRPQGLGRPLGRGAGAETTGARADATPGAGAGFPAPLIDEKGELGLELNSLGNQCRDWLAI